MKKEGRLLNALLHVSNIAIFNKAIKIWRSKPELSFEEILISLAKNDNSFRRVDLNDEKTISKFFKYMETSVTFVILNDMFLTSNEISKDIINEDEITKFIDICEIDDNKKVSLKTFFRTLRNNLAHNNFDDLGLTTKGKNYIIHLPQTKNNDEISLQLTKEDVVRLLYFSILFWNKNTKFEGSIEDEFHYLKGDVFSIKNKNNIAPNFDTYIAQIEILSQKFLQQIVQTFDKNNPLQENVKLTSAINFARCANSLFILKFLFQNRNIKFQDIQVVSLSELEVLDAISMGLDKVQEDLTEFDKKGVIPNRLSQQKTKDRFDKDPDNRLLDLHLVKNMLEHADEDLISLDTIAKMIFANIDENYFNAVDPTNSKIKTLRNSFIHNRYSHDSKKKSYILIKKINRKSKDLECYGEISETDLEDILADISHEQYIRTDVRKYINENIEVENKSE